MFDFSTNLTVDTLDTVPPEFQGLYGKGADGKFAIIDTARGLVEAYTGVTKTLGTEQKAKKTANDEAAARRHLLKGVKDLAQQKLGVTIEDDATLVDSLNAAVDAVIAKAGNGQQLKIDLDKVRADFEKQIASAVASSKGEVETMRGSLEKYMRDGAAQSALAAAGVISPDLLMPHVQRSVKVVQNGDEFVAAVVDGEGNARLNAKGAPMTVAELVNEMKTNPTYAPAFKSEVRAGSGMQPGAVRKVVAQPAKGDDRTSTDKISAGLAARGAK